MVMSGLAGFGSTRAESRHLLAPSRRANGESVIAAFGAELMKKLVRLACKITLLASCCSTLSAQPVRSLNLSALPKVAEVDNRFQSYNIEMVEVTGGQFWAPYGGPPGSSRGVSKGAAITQTPPLTLWPIV